MEILTVYFSRKGQNYWNGSIKYLSKGNTEIASQFICNAVGGDLFEVERTTPYSVDYYACTDEAQKELYSNARPELVSYSNIDKYEIVFVGYPNWWGTMPMAMFSFMERCDFTGKTVIPFCTNEGSGMGRSERDLQKICKGAQLVKGLSVRGSETAESEHIIACWAKKVVAEASK